MFYNGFKETLVDPYWTSASYWPLIAHRFSPYVKDQIIFPGKVAMAQGTNKKSLLGSPAWTGEVFALIFHQLENGYDLRCAEGPDGNAHFVGVGAGWLNMI